MIKISNKKQSLVSSRLRDKRRKLEITLYEVPNDASVHTKEMQFTETFSRKKVTPPKFYLVKSNNFI